MTPLIWVIIGALIAIGVLKFLLGGMISGLFKTILGISGAVLIVSMALGAAGLISFNFLNLFPVLGALTLGFLAGTIINGFF